jgi:hypothetical protein
MQKEAQIYSTSSQKLKLLKYVKIHGRILPNTKDAHTTMNLIINK